MNKILNLLIHIFNMDLILKTILKNDKINCPKIQSFNNQSAFLKIHNSISYKLYFHYG